MDTHVPTVMQVLPQNTIYSNMSDQFMKKDKILNVNIVAKKWQLGKDSKIILGNPIIQSIVKYVKNKFRIRLNSKDMSYLCTKIPKVPGFVKNVLKVYFFRRPVMKNMSKINIKQSYPTKIAIRILLEFHSHLLLTRKCQRDLYCVKISQKCIFFDVQL